MFVVVTSSLRHNFVCVGCCSPCRFPLQLGVVLVILFACSYVPLGVIILFVFIALLLFLGVRTLELRLLNCCYRIFWCCDPRRRSQGERIALNKDEMTCM